MFNVSLTDVYNKLSEIPAYTIKNVQKIEFAEVTKSVFESPYTPPVAASISGILFAKSLVGLIKPRFDKRPWMNLALSVIAGAIAYNGNNENSPLIPSIFLATAITTSLFLGENSAARHHPRWERVPNRHGRTTVNGVERPFTNDEKSLFDNAMNQAFGPGGTMDQAFGSGGTFDQAFGRRPRG